MNYVYPYQGKINNEQTVCYQGNSDTNGTKQYKKYKNEWQYRSASNVDFRRRTCRITSVPISHFVKTWSQLIRVQMINKQESYITVSVPISSVESQ